MVHCFSVGDNRCDDDDDDSDSNIYNDNNSMEQSILRS